MDPKLLDRYQSSSGAAAYRQKYERSWVRRLSNRRELAMVGRALERAGTAGRVLDCPCGAGRLTPTLLQVAEHVSCVDISAAMVEEAREALAAFEGAGRVDFHVAPAYALPFADDTFDTAVCHRLIHHMAEKDERAAVMAELARVATRRVVLSFSDDSTHKGRSQRRRGVTRKRHALLPEDFYAEAAAHGLRPVGAPFRLNGLFSLVAVAVLEVGPRTA
jgi:ubiquinone/menaquinone biosynthesis C-methylase UbiE